MTTKLETEKGILRERVREATIELQIRNQQLQETNLELWHTNRRMNELAVSLLPVKRPLTLRTRSERRLT